MARLIAVDAADDEALDAATAALLAGEPIVVPTDTVYGLAVAALVPGAADALFELKDRPPDRRVAVLVAERSQALEFAAPPSPAVERVMEEWWPGPLTVVLPRRAGVVLDLGPDDGSVGVRCPDHDFVRALAARVGPLATTSANPHGEPTPTTAAAVVEALPGVSIVIDGGECMGQPSTVVSTMGATPEVVREGVVPAAKVLALLEASPTLGS